jgi:hypothetical protein
MIDGHDVELWEHARRIAKFGDREIAAFHPTRFREPQG